MSSKALEDEFHDAGKKAGLAVWRIENFRATKLKKEDFGKATSFFQSTLTLIEPLSQSDLSIILYNILMCNKP